MAEKGMQVMSGKLGAFASALLASCFFGAVDVSPYMRSSADELPCGAVPSERQLAREKSARRTGPLPEAMMRDAHRDDAGEIL